MSHQNEENIKIDPIPASFYKKTSFHPCRVSYVRLFNEELKKYPKFSSLPLKKRTSITLSIECSCYNYALNFTKSRNLVASWDSCIFCDIYNNKCYNVICNIDGNSFKFSGELTELILQGEIDPNNVGKMNNYELCPTKNKEVKKIIERRKQTHERNTKTSKIYTCSRCRRSEVTIKRVQTRSLDEGYTSRVTCMFCGHSFSV